MYDGGPTFLLGAKNDGGSDPDARDLPRNTANPPRALIGDPRNDENTIVSQLQGLFLRFHNRIVKDHPEIDANVDFAQIQKLVPLSLPISDIERFLATHRPLQRAGRFKRWWPILQEQVEILSLEA